MIKFDNVGFVYGTGSPFEKTALKEINLNIMQGQLMGIIGHTGSGKSTLVQLMNALLLPSEGAVYVGDKCTAAKNVKLRDVRSSIGMVFQYPEHQLFEDTIQREIAFGPKNMGLNNEQVDERVRWAMSMVDIPDEWRERSPFELSGGQKRRVAIAGVLSMRPKVLVLDEPTAGLDPHGRRELLKTINHMHKDMGVTVILVSHNMEDIAEIADRIIVMHKGTIRFDGTPAEVFSNIDELSRIGLDVPEVTRLTHRLGLPMCYTLEQAKKVIGERMVTSNA